MEEVMVNHALAGTCTHEVIKPAITSCTKE